MKSTKAWNSLTSTRLSGTGSISINGAGTGTLSSLGTSSKYGSWDMDKLQDPKLSMDSRNGISTSLSNMCFSITFEY